MRIETARQRRTTPSEQVISIFHLEFSRIIRLCQTTADKGPVRFVLYTRCTDGTTPYSCVFAQFRARYNRRSGLQFTQALPEFLTHAKPDRCLQARIPIFCVPTLQLATPALLTELTAHEEC